MNNMNTKTVPLTASTFVEEATPHPLLGPITLEMPEGPATCYDAETCTIITGARPTTDDRFLVVISVAEVDGERIGTLAQMTPAEARRFAGSLLAGVAECESECG